jgi:hypothetical protein
MARDGWTARCGLRWVQVVVLDASLRTHSRHGLCNPRPHTRPDAHARPPRAHVMRWRRSKCGWRGVNLRQPTCVG